MHGAPLRLTRNVHHGVRTIWYRDSNMKRNRALKHGDQLGISCDCSRLTETPDVYVEQEGLASTVDMSTIYIYEHTWHTTMRNFRKDGIVVSALAIHRLKTRLAVLALPEE